MMLDPKEKLHDRIIDRFCFKLKLLQFCATFLFHCVYNIHERLHRSKLAAVAAK